MGGRQVGDEREFVTSDYFLPNDFVDQYANEVGPRAKQTVDPADPDDVELEPESGDPTDGDSVQHAAPCADNWKAAAGAERKRMWAIFDETGIFASSCRHGLILWLADMVRCGELWVHFKS